MIPWHRYGWSMLVIGGAHVPQVFPSPRISRLLSSSSVAVFDL